MNRRQYLQAVGASFALPSVVGTATAREQDEQRPVFYTVSVPEIDTQILHISIPQRILNESNYLWSVSDSNDVALNISREETEDPWEMLNLSVQTDRLKRVSVGGIEARRWDTLEFDQIALLVSGDATHSYLGIVGDGSSVHIDGVGQSWTWESCDYERVRVETTNTNDLSVKAITDGDLKRVPVFGMNASYFSRA